MTTCTTFANSIKKRIEEGKTLDEIAKELCTDVKFSRAKVIRVIKDFLGEGYLIQHADILKYDVGKAQLARKKTSQKKIDAPADDEFDRGQTYHLVLPVSPEVLDAVRKLLQCFSFEDVVHALEVIQNETPTPANKETSINSVYSPTDLKDERIKTE